MDTNGHIHTSFVIAKTNGSSSVEQDYSHNFSKMVFEFSLEDVFAWTDSTIVLNWMTLADLKRT